jgi:hypothetical protein
VTADRKRPNQSFQPAWEERTRRSYLQEDPENRSGAGFAVALVMLFALAVLCVAGFMAVRLLVPGSSPGILPKFETWTPSPTADSSEPQPTAIPSTSIPGKALLNITPQEGAINTLITVAGQGWWPGEPVFVFLRSRDEGEGQGYSYAAAVADDNGNMHTALTFPNEMRWIGQDWADVIARGSRSGREASIRFTLLTPTATPTLPPPTARPTLPPTRTPAPTNTPLPTYTPTPELVITDWRGEYYANVSVSGNPVLVRNDVSIAFNWGEGSPGPQVPAERFSARWTRRLRFEEGRYRFVASADDGVRLWIDGQLVIDQWHDGALTHYSADVDLTAGRHALQLEYYENVGGAAVELTWSLAHQATATPTTTPTPLPSLPLTWHAEYYANPDLAGTPVLVREDANVNFDWGSGSPDGSIPTDGFSVRWTQDDWTDSLDYRFVLNVDDGVRLWVDGVLLIDEWHRSTGVRYRAEMHLSQGVHRFRIEYYEGHDNASISYKRKRLSN